MSLSLKFLLVLISKTRLIQSTTVGSVGDDRPSSTEIELGNPRSD